MHDRGHLRLIEPIPKERCAPALEHRQHQAWMAANAAAAAVRPHGGGGGGGGGGVVVRMKEKPFSALAAIKEKCIISRVCIRGRKS